MLKLRFTKNNNCKIYFNSRAILRKIKIQGGEHGFGGVVLEDMIKEDFEKEVYDLMDNVVEFLNKQNLKYKNMIK